jgi:hypothetical protein
MPEDQKVYDDFEVSFNYRNVLFICQVKLITEINNNWYYTIDYFSPNEKGHVERLVAKIEKDEGEETFWSEQSNEHEPDFLQTLGKVIEKHEI